MVRKTEAVTTTLFLVRHAEASHEGDSPGLTPEGEHQAGRLGRRLAGTRFAAIEHSPLRREIQTAELVAASMPGVPVGPSEYLRDLTAVPEPGQESDYPADRLDWLASVPEEECDPGARRLRAAVEHYLADTAADTGEDRNLLLITHAFVVGWFVRHALDAPTWRWIGLNSANTGLSTIRVATGRPPVLVGFNDVGHLLG